MDAQGEASAATIFEYHEYEGVVWARYEGRFGSASWSGSARTTIFSSATAS
jgi:hypothetical protein